MRRPGWRGYRWPWRPCSSRRTCGARSPSPSGSAGSAESRSAPASSGRSRPFCGTTLDKGKRKRMRRVSLVLLGGAGMLTVAGMGCDAVKNAFSPRAEIVARANDQTLTVERMGDWAGSGKQVPLDPMALSRLAHVWVDYALLAQSFASGQDLRDSATM